MGGTSTSRDLESDPLGPDPEIDLEFFPLGCDSDREGCEGCEFCDCC